MLEYVFEQLPEHKAQAVRAGLVTLVTAGFFTDVVNTYVRQIAESLVGDQEEESLAKEIVELRRKVAIFKELHDLGDKLGKER